VVTRARAWPFKRYAHAIAAHGFLAGERMPATVVADVMIPADRIGGIYRILVIPVLVETGIVRRKVPSGPVGAAPPPVHRNLT
jgi:hypothetical protein